MNLFLLSLLLTMNLLLPNETPADREKRVRSELLLPFQQRWADDRSRMKVIEKCRQAGISWTEAYVTVDETSKQGAKRDTWISSRDLAQARLFGEDCKYWNRQLGIVAEQEGLVLLEDVKDEQAYRIDYATGRTIYSLSSNPDAQAGKRGRRVGDEFALQKQQRQWYAITLPGLQWGGQMSLISTHRGTHSFFNKEIVEPARHTETNKKKFSLHTVTIESAVREGLWLKIRSQLEPSDDRYEYDDDAFLQAARDACPDEETWLQEYCCVPADDAAAFLSWELITACSETAVERAARVYPADAPRYVGYDVARKQDLSVITVLCDIGGVLVDEDVIVMKNTPFAEQERRLDEVMQRPGVKQARLDATGLGMQMAERAERRYPGRAQGVMFNMQSKQELAFPLRARFEDRKIRIRDDRLYTADLRSIKKTVTAAGNIIITSEAGATDGHADRFWSLALACHAATQNFDSTAAVVLNGNSSVRRLMDSAIGMFGRSGNRRGVNCG